jgi:cyclophilin family peptidyl-prolyl cis-trans isomerase
MPVQRLARAIRQLFRQQSTSRRPAERRARPQLLALEERWVPAGIVTGVAFIDLNHNGVRDAAETALPGITVTLHGQTTAGQPTSVTTTTNANGQFLFNRLHAGSYQVVASNNNYLGQLPGGVTVANIPSLADGQTVNVQLPYRGLSPTSVSLRRFLASSPRGVAAISPAGTGIGTANLNPFVSTAIGNKLFTTSTTTTTIDLAPNFNDPDLVQSRVRMVTSQGNIDLTLEDRLAPLTVRNFLRYVNNNLYDNIIFHRLGAFLHSGSTTRDVLQGGQFQFSSNASNQGNLTSINTFGTVPDEVNLPNTAGTIAMAKTGSPNSATSQFFFNLIDNTDQLSAPPQTNGGFTVFGHIDAASQPVVNALAASNVQNKSTFNGALTDLPLSSRVDSTVSFPSGTVASDYALIRDVQVLRSNDEALTFQVIGNTRPTLVTASVQNHHLTLNFVGSATGTATITVRATDRFGGSVVTSFNVARS